MIIARHASPLGSLTLASDGAALRGLYFEQHKPGGPPQDAELGSDEVITQTRRGLDAYFAGKARAFDLPLAFSGTSFQMEVWRALLAIPFGETVSYGALAKRIGEPAAVRALGAAVGRNPISIIAPCHRVVGADGSLTGYAGGVERKRALLAFERGEARFAASP
jgi:methylated-DNA-[protein]-cysteine S-methyltransferase